MLGWGIIIERQADGGAKPAGIETPDGVRIAEWDAEVMRGLDWLEELVKTGKAIQFGDAPGYPFSYTARAEDVVPYIFDAPYARGDRKMEYLAVKACRPDEWLQIEAWDLS